MYGLGIVRPVYISTYEIYSANNFCKFYTKYKKDYVNNRYKSIMIDFSC